MKIIHLSDFHYENTVKQNNIIDALVSDLTKEVTAEEICFIACTGDFGHKGIINAEMYNKVFLRLKALFPGALIMLCPGNHDMNLAKKISRYQVNFDNIKDIRSTNSFTSDWEISEPIFDYLKDYKNLEKQIHSCETYDKGFYTYQIFTQSTQKIGVIALNSAWLSPGKGDDDYAKLRVGESVLEAAIQQIHECDIKIALMHHSLDWLKHDEKISIQRILTHNIDILLCGHNHTPDASYTVNSTGKLCIVNAGCLYQSSDYYNGYSIIQVTDEELHVRAREYFLDRQVFDSALRLGSNGNFSMPRSKIEISHTLLPSGKISELVATVSAIANSRLFSYNTSEVAPKAFGQIFVEPKLANCSEAEIAYKMKAEQEKVSIFTLGELAKSNKNLLIFGVKESGKTTLLYEIASNKYIEFSPRAQVGVIVDFSLLQKKTLHEVFMQANSFLGANLEIKRIKQLCSEQGIIFCFDRELNYERQFSKRFALNA